MVGKDEKRLSVGSVPLLGKTSSAVRGILIIGSTFPVIKEILSIEQSHYASSEAQF